MPRGNSSATMSACKSENARTRSGSSARILGISAEVKALTRGFSRRACGGGDTQPGTPRDEGAAPRLLAPRLRRAHDIAGNSDDAVLLAEQVQGLDGLLGQTDDPARREHREASSAPRASPRRA